MKSRSSTRTLKKGQSSIAQYKFEESPDEQRQQWATLKDLCPEEKMKIGLLIQSLAAAKEEKEQVMRDLKERTKQYKQSVKKIKQQSQIVMAESKQTEEKFKESLHVLREYQHKFDLITQQSSPKKQAYIQLSADKQTQVHAERKESEQQTESQQQQQPFLVRRLGESEEKLSSLRPQPMATTEFPMPPQEETSDLQRLKMEIEELTNGLKQLHFGGTNPIEASFSCENQKYFQTQFQKFETQLNEQQEKKLPKKGFISESSSSSDTDDVELAKRLLSLKKAKSSSRGQLTRSTQQGGNASQQLSTAKDTAPMTSDLQRYRQLDQKLSSIMGSSQSYNLSLTHITPQKIAHSQVNTPADFLQSRSKVSEKLSTPRPEQERPNIYIQENQNRSLFDKSKSIIEDEEIDCLIDSLNNRQPQRNYLFEPQSENRPRQIMQSQVLYDGGLYDMINRIETPKEDQYEKMMQRMVDLYHNDSD